MLPLLNRERTRDIWRLTWPQAIMLLCQFVIGLTDVWAGGRIGSEVQASIGLITQCQMIFMTIAMGAVSGAVASISQSLGAGEKTQARRFVGLVVIGGIGIGCLLAVLGYTLRVPFLRLVQTPDTIFQVAMLFFSTYLWSLPGQYALTIGGAVFRAAKSVLMPLYVTIVVCILNLFGDLAFGLGWWGFPAFGASGIAWATFVSVTAGGLFLLALLFRQGLLTRESLPPLRWIRSDAPYLFKVAGPAFGTSAMWQSGYLTLFMITASLPVGSVTALAGLTTGLRVEAILFLPAVAFNMTASVLVGHALGAGNPAEAKRVALTILAIACGGMSFVGACLWPWRAELAGLLAPDPAVAAETASYLMYNILSVPFTVASVVLAGVLNGAGATVYPMASFSISIWLVRLPLAWLLGHVILRGASGIYLSMLLSQLVQSSSLLWVLLYKDWTRYSMFGHACASCAAPTPAGDKRP